MSIIALKLKLGKTKYTHLISTTLITRRYMYLRWMVRKDNNGVDFGIWSKIKMPQLVCPLDVHVARVAERLQLIPTIKADWNNATLLTSRLKELNPKDPAVYDYALFGLGAEERM